MTWSENVPKICFIVKQSMKCVKSQWQFCVLSVLSTRPLVHETHAGLQSSCGAGDGMQDIRVCIIHWTLRVCANQGFSCGARRWNGAETKGSPGLLSVHEWAEPVDAPLWACAGCWATLPSKWREYLARAWGRKGCCATFPRTPCSVDAAAGGHWLLSCAETPGDSFRFPKGAWAKTSICCCVETEGRRNGALAKTSLLSSCAVWKGALENTSTATPSSDEALYECWQWFWTMCAGGYAEGNVL